MVFLNFLVSLLLALTSWVEGAEYQENLSLRPLPNSALLADFNFRSNTTLAAFDEQNFRFFPRSLGQILQHAHTKELHLRFSLGRWDAEVWGARPRGGRREGGTGVELWAWIEADTDQEANARWLTLSNALSGLFCASLNFIDSTKTIRPASTFDSEGTTLHANSPNLHLLHGALPHEVVCTENLTPFLKLLPCKGKAGISTLLDGHKLFDASWQSMAIDVRPFCPADGSECLLEIEQTVDMVLDLERSMRPQHDPLARPPPLEDIACDESKSYRNYDTCFPSHRTSERAWSLSEVFGRPIKGSCPLSNDMETVSLDISPDVDVFTTSAGPFVERKSESGTRHYQLPTSGNFDIALPEQPLISPDSVEQPRLYAERAFVGYGQERGGVRSVLTNPSPSEPADLVYLESLPWFMKPYLHTLSATVSSSTSEDPIKEIIYRPAVDRHRGTHLELRITVPPASTVTLTYDFDKAILRYTEYPPDANRGFDVAPAIVRVLPSLDGQQSLYLRTTSLLLPLPTPDFSMPYNVIILTSTVIAMAFGSVFNLLVRRFVASDEVPKPQLLAIRDRLKTKFAVLKERVMKGKDEVTEKKVQ
ncbi:GPI transamidase-like protein component Gpi16 [Delphinella strobiligena]|nr:GPI transamidase-like protein component Gpi16 [Delphinella strobiligena]